MHTQCGISSEVERGLLNSRVNGSNPLYRTILYIMKFEPFTIVDGIKYYNCPDCGGTGETMMAHMYPTGHTEVWSKCEFCEGEGRFEESDYLIMKLEGIV